MENYDEEMFDFLSSEKNIRGLIIANEQFTKVRSKLIQNFWEKVRGNLEISLRKHENWIVVLEDNIFAKKSKLYVYEKNLPRHDVNKFPLYMFTWEDLSDNPFAGLYLNMEMEDYKMQDMMDFLVAKKSIIAGGYEDTDGCWPFWTRDKQIDFKNDESLVEISKEKLESKAKSFSDTIYQMMDKIIFSNGDIYDELKRFENK